MQQLKKDQFVEDSLRVMKPAAAPDEVRAEMLAAARPQSHALRWASTAAAAVAIISVGAWSLNRPAQPETNLAQGLTKEQDAQIAQEVSHVQPLADVREVSATKDVAMQLAAAPKQSQRYLLKSHGADDLVYVDDVPYRKVRYLVMDRKEVDVDGGVMEVVQPRQEEYMVPVSIY